MMADHPAVTGKCPGADFVSAVVGAYIRRWTLGMAPYVYADDKPSLCAGNTIEIARRRARQAVGTLVRMASAIMMITTMIMPSD